MKKYKEKKPFKREYIPVIIAVLIFIGLLLTLIFVIKDNKTDFEPNVDKEINNSEDLNVDTNNTKCSNEDAKKLKEAAKKIKVSYETKKISIGMGEVLDSLEYEETELFDTGFAIKITGITEDVYVVVKNDYSGDIFTYHYADTENGTKEIESLANDELVTFTFDVKSENTNCKDETYRKISLTTPIYNSYSEWQYCADNPGLNVCEKLVYEKVTSEEFDEAIKSNDEEKEIKDNKTNIIKDNKYVFIIGGSVVIIGVATALVQIKKRRSR